MILPLRKRKGNRLFHVPRYPCYAKSMLKRHLQNLAALAFGLVFLGGATEGLLRLLPVNSGLNAQEVTDHNPVLRYLPDRNYIYSKGPLLKMVNEGRVNNEGFVNDQDYAKDTQLPLIAVIGDSFVEALMVPYSQTAHGRMADTLVGKASVYSFAGSGAPLSQYLVWADHARRNYRPDAMVFIIVGNDFDESLLTYKQAPGLHYFQSSSDGGFTLKRIDYQPTGLRKFLRRSAVARYLVLNFNIDGLLSNPLVWIGSKEGPGKFAGNVDASSDPVRLADSQRAVQEFLARLPSATGLSPDKILFLVDGFRYPDAAKAADQSYFGQMRRYFLSKAAAAGYEAIDMDTVFLPHYLKQAARFEFPNDGHWNGLAHALAAEESIKSKTLNFIGR